MHVRVVDQGIREGHAHRARAHDEVVGLQGRRSIPLVAALTPHRRALPRSFASRLAMIATAALAVRVAYTLLIKLRFGFDAIWYGLQAGTIATGHGYIDPAAFYQQGREVATANFPPVWPGVLSLVHLLGGRGQRPYQLAGCVVGVGTVVVTGMLARRVAGPAVGLVAAGLTALHPFLVAADASMMADSLFVCLTTLSVLLALRAATRPTTGRWIVLGLVLGLAALTRSDGLVIGLALLAVSTWGAASATRARRVRLAVIGLFTFVVVLTPWSIRNSVRMDELVVLSSNSSGLLEGANCPTTYDGPLIGLWDAKCLRFARAAELSESAGARRARTAGLRYARDNAQRLAVVAGVRVLRVWGLYDPIDQSRSEAVESRREGWQVLGWVWSLGLLVVAVPGALALRRAGADIDALLAVVGSVTLLAAISWGNQRFRLAADPVICIFAAAAVCRFLRRPVGPNHDQVGRGALRSPTIRSTCTTNAA
jgi:4-amino-4-deoxy-L-arabinose transferase-like glycosyltransferase